MRVRAKASPESSLALALPRGWEEFVENFFKERPVRTVHALETALTQWHKAFRDKTPMEKGGKPTRRTRGENLTDWVKAHLTSRRKTWTVKMWGEDWLLWYPLAGDVHGTALVDERVAAAVVRSLVNMVNANR